MHNIEYYKKSVQRYKLLSNKSAHNLKQSIKSVENGLRSLKKHINEASKQINRTLKHSKSYVNSNVERIYNNMQIIGRNYLARTEENIINNDNLASNSNGTADEKIKMLNKKKADVLREVYEWYKPITRKKTKKQFGNILADRKIKEIKNTCYTNLQKNNDIAI